MAAPPRRKFSTICAVTTWGYALTPSATAPWSAAKVKTAGCSTRGGSPRRVASRTASSSRRPRLPGGLVSWSRWRRAAPAPAGSGARIASRSFGSEHISAHRGLHGHRDPRHHEGDSVAGGGHTLVHEAEEIAK